MNPIDRDYDDFFARIILHEVDHLNGILYKQRCPKGLITNEELQEKLKKERNQLLKKPLPEITDNG